MKGIIHYRLCVIGLFIVCLTNFHNSYFDDDHVPMIFMRRHQQNLDWARLDQPLYSSDKKVREMATRVDPIPSIPGIANGFQQAMVLISE